MSAAVIKLDARTFREQLARARLEDLCMLNLMNRFKLSAHVYFSFFTIIIHALVGQFT